MTTPPRTPLTRAVHRTTRLPHERDSLPPPASPSTTSPSTSTVDRRGGERGSMSVFVVVFSVVVFMLAGLLVDGGAAINARLRAADIAEQAARAAADQIDEDHLRETGQAILLAGDQACGRAEEIVGAHDAEEVEIAECTVGDGQARVTVAVQVRWDAFFLAALGFEGSQTRAAATAGPDIGEADAVPDAP